MSFERICADLEQAIGRIPDLGDHPDTARQQFETFKANASGKDLTTLANEASELNRSWIALSFLGPTGNPPGQTDVIWAR
ncbi:MAG TPA: hypothetical protein VMR25_00350 [Planctomycetaceae bacterium]|jgi:hypothetical protein|nr:hypothetical protein [Planctomycetaceae bacterium]